MKCEEIGKKVSAYVDGELDSQLTHEMSLHLSHCTACRKELEQFKQINVLLKAMPRRTLSPQFAGRVLTAMAEPNRADRPHGVLHRTRAWLLAWPGRFFDLLQAEAPPATRTLREFDDLPASFIGYAYFKILGS